MKISHAYTAEQGALWWVRYQIWFQKGDKWVKRGYYISKMNWIGTVGLKPSRVTPSGLQQKLTRDLLRIILSGTHLAKLLIKYIVTGTSDLFFDIV